MKRNYGNMMFLIMIPRINNSKNKQNILKKLICRVKIMSLILLIKIIDRKMKYYFYKIQILSL
jgi:hypothetical protein